ncbi:dendritic cell-specific transmembrane protein [Pristis pectinata]|uniref:dendritic cell-specific transmembrane protein n=1 Tax=Pristis pectinata TaxID=685728 RepID=UPI00223DD07C|nr:dendritic cell-specific transmembrane protein [Pristis pectinata]
MDKVSPIAERTSLNIKMAILKIAAQFFGDLFEVFASERKSGLKNILYLVSLCLLLGMGSSGIVYICLQKLQCNLSVALAVCGTFTVVIPGALFLSKHLRCFTLIFLISCGTKQGRNALITVGTSIVVFHCAQNSFDNLMKLVENLDCYLVGMLPSIRDLLSKYIEVLKWISNYKISGNPFIRIVDEFKVYHKVDDDDIKIKLNATRMNMEILANNTMSKFGTFTTVCKNAMTVMGVLLILLFTWFYIRRFLTNVKFENIFVTNQLLQFDEKQKEVGKPHLLPLTKKEKKCFIRIPALSLSEMEWKSMAGFLVPILRNLCIWTILIMLDYGIYLLTDSIRHHIDHLPTINITMNVKFSEENTKLNIIKTKKEYEETFSSYVHLSKDACILQSTLSIDAIWSPLLILLVILLLLTLLSAKLTTLKIIVLSSFYKETEEKRIQFLHEKILQKRRWANLFNIEEVLNPATNVISFWFPIFKMKQNKKELQNQKDKIIRFQKFGEFHIEL